MFRALLRYLPGNLWLLGSGAVCVVALVVLVVGIVYAVNDPGATVSPSSNNTLGRRRSRFVISGGIKNLFIRMLIASAVLGWLAIGMLWRGLATA